MIPGGYMGFIKTRGKHEALITVDDDQHELLNQYCWRLDKFGYARTNIRIGLKEKTIYMHQMLMGQRPGFIIDHINRNKLDNRMDNLRFCSHKENARNSSKKSASSLTSNFIGVGRSSPQSSTWRARITVDGMLVHIGSFNTQEDAAMARDKAAKKFFGGFASLNFPEAI